MDHHTGDKWLIHATNYHKDIQLQSLKYSVGYPQLKISGPILGLRPANERRRYFVSTSFIGWA